MDCKCDKLKTAIIYQKSGPVIDIVTDDPKQFHKAHEADGGYDIVASQITVISAGSRALVSTGLKVGIPFGYVGILKSRSGLATKHGLEHGAGVIDSGYTGEVKVLIQNHSNIDYTVDHGDKIAQMLIIPIATIPVKRVKSLEDSERGEGGFNSTGTKHE